MAIWQHIHNWLGIGNPGERRSVLRRRTDIQLASITPGSPLGAQELEREFIGLLLGVHSFVDTGLNALERKALKAMQALNGTDLDASGLLQQLPAIVMDALKGGVLIQRIGQDQILAKEIIRLANTPYYRGSQVVKSLEEAATHLGEERVRQLVAHISVKPVFNTRRGHFGPLATPRLWAQAERCAVASDCLAKSLRIDPFTAYLAGLVSNTGLYLGARVLDQVSDGTHSPHAILFRQRFVHEGRLLAIKVARFWQLPPKVIDALAQLAAADDIDELETAGGVLFAAEKLSQLRMLIESGRVENDFSRFTCRLSGQLTDSCSHCFRELERYSN